MKGRNPGASVLVVTYINMPPHNIFEEKKLIQRKYMHVFSASDKNHFDARDVSRVKTDDYFVVQFINAKQGNIEKAHKLMVC